MPMDKFTLGDKVALRAAPKTRGLVVRLTDDGHFVTVEWSLRFGMEGRQSTHRPEVSRPSNAVTERPTARASRLWPSSLKTLSRWWTVTAEHSAVPTLAIGVEHGRVSREEAHWEPPHFPVGRRRLRYGRETVTLSPDAEMLNVPNAVAA